MSLKMRTSHYCISLLKNGLFMTSRDAIFHGIRLFEQEANEAGKRRQ